jgi:hypothetical protein
VHAGWNDRVSPAGRSGQRTVISSTAWKGDFVEAGNKFPSLRKRLYAIGLSPEATDDIIERINDLLSEKGDKSP